MALNTGRVGLIAGSVGGLLLGLFILTVARGREAVGRRVGAIAAVLPLVWLPYFAIRGMARRESLLPADIISLVLMVVVPLAIAAWAGTLIGGRLARAGR
jgi:ABC-type nitrate/sulfonate/bicarbonate transport system permease component